MAKDSKMQAEKVTTGSGNQSSCCGIVGSKAGASRSSAVKDSREQVDMGLTKVGVGASFLGWLTVSLFSRVVSFSLNLNLLLVYRPSY